MIHFRKNHFEFFLVAIFFLLADFCFAAQTIDKTMQGDSNLSSGNSSATILIYHRFGEERYPTTNVSVERFREQMLYLRENSYRVLPLQKLLSLLSTGKAFPAKTVAITIDDGYKSVYETAWPVLKEFGYPFTVFLYVKATDNKHWDYMDWNQVRELQTAGVDFQDHGYAHHRFGSRPQEMNEEEYIAWIRDDFTKSSTLIEKELGYKPTMLAYPYGEYNRVVVKTAKELGFTSLFSQDPGSVSHHTDFSFIPREPILGTDWSSMEHFAMVLDRVDLPIADMMPDIQRLVHPAPPVFSARLLFPDRYKPGTLGIYVSELGWQPAQINNGYISITNEKKLLRRANRIAVSGREKVSGKTAIRFWLLLQEESSTN